MYMLDSEEWSYAQYSAQAEGVKLKAPNYKKANVKKYKWDGEKQCFIKK